MQHMIRDFTERDLGMALASPYHSAEFKRRAFAELLSRTDADVNTASAEELEAAGELFDDLMGA